MKSKGFTLIELLSVIVILAIIALIATPIILSIIEDAREEANKRSIDLYASAVKNAIATYQLHNDDEPTSFLDIEKYIEYDGKVDCIKKELYSNGTFYLAECKVNGEEVEYTYGKEIVNLSSKVCKVTEGNGSTIGDIITCTLTNGDEDKFYVISNDGTNIQMLTELNIDLTSYQQSSTAQNIAFASSRGFDGLFYFDLTTEYKPAGNSHYRYVYDKNSDTYIVVEGYVNYLNSNGLIQSTGKLMSYEQFKDIAILDGNYYKGPDWIFSGKGFWLGSAGYSVVFYTYADKAPKGCLGNDNCAPDYPDNNSAAGVRPVITINTSEIG